MQHTITIVISRTNTMIGAIIRKVHKGPYNHCSFYLDDKSDEMWSFSRKYDRFFFTGCFCSETAKRYEEYCTFTFNLTNEQYQSIVDEIRFLSSRYNMYSYWNSILINFNKSINSNKHYICSTYVASVIERLGLVNLNKAYDKCLLMDVYNSLKLGAL